VPRRLGVVAAPLTTTTKSSAWPGRSMSVRSSRRWSTTPAQRCSAAPGPGWPAMSFPAGCGL